MSLCAGDVVSLARGIEGACRGYVPSSRATAPRADDVAADAVVHGMLHRALGARFISDPPRMTLRDGAPVDALLHRGFYIVDGVLGTPRGASGGVSGSVTTLDPALATARDVAALWTATHWGIQRTLADAAFDAHAEELQQDVFLMLLALLRRVLLVFPRTCYVGADSCEGRRIRAGAYVSDGIRVAQVLRYRGFHIAAATDDAVIIEVELPSGPGVGITCTATPRDSTEAVCIDV